VEKRLIIFVVVSLAIIFMYPVFINWMAPSNPRTAPSVSQSIEQDESHHEDEKTSEPLSSKEVKSEEAIDVTNLNNDGTSPSIEEQVPEVETTIESDLYRVTLSNLGGTIKKWELKKYTKYEEEGAEGPKEPIQLVFGEGRRLPLEIIFSEESSESKRIYQMDGAVVQLDKAHPDVTVKMVSTDSAGRTIKKELRFHFDRYLVDLKLETSGYNQDYDLSLGTNLGIQEWAKQRGKSAGGITLVDTEVFRDSPGDMEEDEKLYEGKPKWVGLQDKYFLSALIPAEDLAVGPVTFNKEKDTEISAQITIKKSTQAQHFSLYVGPKEYDRLDALNVNLDESIDFGWFIGGSLLLVRLISKPIFYLLRFFYQFTQNYGISIILVTVLVKAFFYPITRKSMKSMKSMSSVQPKINALKKQWANNKEKMNQEMIKLYKTEKVNPLGGCLPMLVQIPVFISLYNILYTTIELRQAPFFLWVQDLSTKDPYYVLPIIMGATMFIQQYTQPSTMESAQAKMMLFLPIVYTYFFLNFPSGLVLYWLVNNSLTIAQQYYLGKEGLSAAKIKAGAS